MGLEHYFSHEPAVPSAPRSFSVSVLGLELSVRSDAGVFSKDGVDPGSHLLLEACEVPAGSSVLDLGCGWGVLGLVIGKRVPGCRVTFLDINRRAVALARSNAERNGLEGASFVTGDGPGALGDRRFDAVVLNPPVRAGKALYYGWAADIAGRLRSGGRFWSVLRRQQGSDSWQRHLASLYPQVHLAAKAKGYRVFWAAGPCSEKALDDGEAGV